jgi:hypothetical protein
MKNLLLLALLMTLSLLLFAEQYTVNANQNEVSLISTSSNQTVLEMTLGHFNREAVRINNTEYWALSLKKEGITLDAGMPQLPYITRSLIIPGMAKMDVQVLETEYIDIQMPIAPSKGNLTRDVNPDDVPWSFDSFYQSTSVYPSELTRLSEPFIIRDYRGITLYLSPFAYYPATQTLRVYTRMKVSVNNVGIDNENVMSIAKSSASALFENIYKGLFVNYNQAKYPVLDEFGRILIIKNTLFDTAIQPYVDWKRQKGYTVNVVDVSVAGPTATQMKTYIQAQYDQNTDLAFVQIMGDHPQVPSLTSGSAASDPSFALLAGTDSYPEIFVGRFSAQTVAEMETQVQRSVYYERDMPVGSTWIAKGMGIASNEGGGSQGDLGESDQVHIEGIRTDLLTYGYTSVDQVYQATGGSIAMISTGVNQGRGFINYCGHGSDTYWVTTGFSNTNVNQLTNDNKLPFIVSVACVNGNYANQTCFAEAWLRAKDSATGAPRGAVAFYGSTINMAWNPPMRGQDEITDLLIANQKNTVGGLYYNGSSKMTEVYGTAGAAEYKCWHIFGDASLQVRTTDPQPLSAQYMNVLFLGMSTFSVQTAPGAWVTLSNNGTVYGTAIANDLGVANITLTTTPSEPMNLTLTITCFNKATLVDVVQVLPSQGPYVMIDEHTISDNNNNQADFGETVYFDLALNNLGSEAANLVTVTISSTDPYITITDNTESFGNIAASAILSSTNGFSIQIANNAPDQHVAPIHVIIYVNGVLSWEYNVNMVLNAPAFAIGNIAINDSDGNNNGRIDAGETVSIAIPVTNTGHAPIQNMYFSVLVTNQVNHVYLPVANNFPVIAPNETVQVIFDFTFSSQVPAGSVAQFMIMGVSGEYSIVQNFAYNIGIVMEDFEMGTFTSFPWTFASASWTMDNTVFHSGAYSAKSATITHSQSTTIEAQINVPVDGSISFWKKVSSEQSYDYLKFYINNVLKNQWSGNVDWSQESYTVTAGLTSFKWEYMKDYMVSSGSDCAWIDDINFPTTGTNDAAPSISVSASTFDFGSHIGGDFEPIEFTITNDGDATMIGNVTGTSLFQVKKDSDDSYHNSVSYVISAGLSMNFSLNFIPLAEGAYNADLIIESDDPDNLITTIPITAVVLPTSNNNNTVAFVTALKGNYPNPFNPETTVHFTLKSDTKVSIEIYNLLGQKVKTLVNNNVKAGAHSVKWNGKDDNGSPVGSGIYFYRMNAGSYRSTSKMILMK